MESRRQGLGHKVLYLHAVARRTNFNLAVEGVGNIEGGLHATQKTRKLGIWQVENNVKPETKSRSRIISRQSVATTRRRVRLRSRALAWCCRVRGGSRCRPSQSCRSPR